MITSTSIIFSNEMKIFIPIMY
ncbi:hypothetical protein Ocin01_08917 [Orchesella cincta]|uniref:Uncharacterized protein n=1 Tax=Orchesella cincta TaxID=48709 RepID=A0A1D2MYN9_ORCCI|nr:hypothetical protein Ocin01_08917 [Orchesella cincta]